jgi:uncharacterized protein (TIGR04562 family)
LTGGAAFPSAAGAGFDSAFDRAEIPIKHKDIVQVIRALTMLWSVMGLLLILNVCCNCIIALSNSLSLAWKLMEKSDLLEKWKFNWPLMDVIIGGRSSIDLPEMRVTTDEEAEAFVRAYGYDLDVPTESHLIHAAIIESVSFIERYLLTPREWSRGIRPPDKILECTDVRNLLVWASGSSPEERMLRGWSCAVLRVMHTIAHIEGVNKQIRVEDARNQIFARFHSALFRDENKNLWFGSDTNRVELEKVEWKESKSRASILLKLLHKRDNVAETIFDFLGIRIVTKRVCDVMMVVKNLMQYNLVVFPNCFPARARNNLIEVDRFRSQIETLREMLQSGSIGAAEFETMVARLIPMGNTREEHINPHSSSDYRSIQLTGRQLIKVPNYQFEWLDRLRSVSQSEGMPESKKNAIKELMYLVDQWHSVDDTIEQSAFFPFEVQIMDHDSYMASVDGEAAHTRYKQNQIRTARKRVIGRVLELHRSI